MRQQTAATPERPSRTLGKISPTDEFHCLPRGNMRPENQDAVQKLGTEKQQIRTHVRQKTNHRASQLYHIRWERFCTDASRMSASRGFPRNAVLWLVERCKRSPQGGHEIDGRHRTSLFPCAHGRGKLLQQVTMNVIISQGKLRASWQPLTVSNYGWNKQFVRKICHGLTCQNSLTGWEVTSYIFTGVV